MASEDGDPVNQTIVSTRRGRTLIASAPLIPSFYGPRTGSLIRWVASDRDGDAVNERLASILDAHGGLVRWREYESGDATLVSGGRFLPLKGDIADVSFDHAEARSW